MHINIALAANVLQILFMSYIAINTPSSWDVRDTLLFLVIIGVPCITLPLLFNFKYNTPSAQRPSSWLCLFLQRKRLEEQQKIERLKSTAHQ